MQPDSCSSLALRTIGAWAVTLLLFFPLGWLVLTAFKTELQAIARAAAVHLRADAGQLRRGAARAATTCCSRATR